MLGSQWSTIYERAEPSNDAAEGILAKEDEEEEEEDEGEAV